MRAAIDTISERAAGENFPVAMRVLPRRYRRHLMAVYRFARLVDDIGDEPGPLPGAAPASAREARGARTGHSTTAGGSGELAAARLLALDSVEHQLGRAFSGHAPPSFPVIRDVAVTAAECGIPAEPFKMLIQANRQDQTVSRYATFEDLLGYCRLSANPVGRIVLHIFGAATPERARLSDLICTALQLAEHWQDVAEDYRRDRVYLPQEDMAAFGCAAGDLEPARCRTASRAGATGLREGHAGYGTPQRVRELMRFETERAGRLLDEGAALTGTLRGWARLAVAGYVAGGRATLAAIAAAGSASAGPASLAGPAGFDVLGKTARPGKARTVASLVRAYLTGR